MNTKRIYNLKQIEAACIIGSPILAGLLIFHNYKMFDEKQKGISWIFIGILWTIAVIGLAMLIPENLVKSTQMIVPVINGLILYPIINKLQGDRINEHFNNDGEKGSNLVLAGLIILMVALFVTPMILLSKLAPQVDYSRKDFNPNGIYNNDVMPINEVDKLGSILKRVDYFNPESIAEVVFISTDSIYELKLITNESSFSDTSFMIYAKDLSYHINSYDFDKPITFKLTDELLKKSKIVDLDNDENLSYLLELTSFEQNPNFRLYYNKEIDSSEREKFQRFILSNSSIFPPQNNFDFLFDVDDNFYSLRLFIQKEHWGNPQLWTELEFCKNQLNTFGFDYPFKLIMVDNWSEIVEEKEII